MLLNIFIWQENGEGRPEKRFGILQPGGPSLGMFAESSWMFLLIQRTGSSHLQKKYNCLLHVIVSLMPILLLALKQTKYYPETWQDFPPSYTGGEDYEDMRGASVFPDCTKCGHIVASVVKALEQASIEGDFLGICIRDHSLKLCRMESSLFWNEILFNVLLPIWACMLGPRLQSSNVRSHKTGRSKGRYSETDPCVLGYSQSPARLSSANGYTISLFLLHASLPTWQPPALGHRGTTVSFFSKPAFLFPACLGHSTRFYYYSTCWH